MSCNCKNTSIDNEFEKTSKQNNTKVINTILNFITFVIVTVIVIPLIIPYMVYILFKTIVLRNSDVNISSTLLKISKKLIEKEGNDDNEEDYQLYENNEYELMDVEPVN